MSNRCSGKGMDIGLKRLEPFFISLNKSISLGDILNPTKLRKECPQLLAGFGLGIGPEPAHPLSLEMIQTSLELSTWPDQPHGSQNGTFTIGSYKSGSQPLVLEIAKPGIRFLKGLLLNIQVGNNFLISAIHKIQQAAVLVKVGCVINHILHSGIIDLFTRCLFQPVVLNAIKGKSAIARKLAKLPDGIALGNPQPEPVLAAVGTVITGFPDKCVLAV